MSSLTSLGVNKNKAKFAPKANRNKVRKRPQADATNNEESSTAATATSQDNSNGEENSQKQQKQPEPPIAIERLVTKPREPSPPPPPPITQITPQSQKKPDSRIPTIIAEAGSPLTPTPDSPGYEPSSSATSRKETVAKTIKKPSKKPAGTSFNTPSNKGTSFSAPSRSGGGTSITVGDRRPRPQEKEKERPSRSDDEEDTMDENGSTRRGRRVKKPKKRKLTDLRPEELKTLEDVSHDPSRIEDLDKPMLSFTKDIDGIVSKNFKEMEKNRYLQRDKMEAMKKMSKEDIEKLKKKEEEEAERKKKELERKKEEERKRLEREKPILEESSHALQVRIVDGEIVLDMDSLTVERPQGTAAYEEGSMEVIEENSMTKKVNSRTYGKQQRTKRWSVLETEAFYEAVAQFGTDFEMIAQLLPNRTRNMVRHKFNKEERVNPERVTEYLIRKKKPMDLERYKSMAGITEFEEVPHDFHEMEIS